MGGFADLARQLRENSQQQAQGAQEPQQPAQPVKYGHLDRMDAERARWAELTSAMAANIRRSSVMRAEINHSINRGDPADQTLLLALECIAAMTGDAMAVKMYTDRHRAAQDAQQPPDDDNTH